MHQNRISPRMVFFASVWGWMFLGALSAQAASMAGTVVVRDGSIVLHRPRMKGARTVRDYARLEMGDSMQVTSETEADVSWFDSTGMALVAGKRYEVRRDGMYRMEANGGLREHTFSVPLGRTTSARQFDIRAGGVGTLEASGQVWVRHSESRRWNEVHQNLELQTHDWVRTGEGGRAFVVTGGRGSVVIEEDSQVQVQISSVVIERGGATVSSARRESRLEIHTEELEADVQGGILRVVRSPGEGSRAGLFSGGGIVRTRGKRQSQRLSPGMVARFDAEGALRGVSRIGDGRQANEWGKELRVSLRDVPRRRAARTKFLDLTLARLHRLDDPREPLARTLKYGAIHSLDKADSEEEAQEAPLGAPRFQPDPSLIAGASRGAPRRNSGSRKPEAPPVFASAQAVAGGASQAGAAAQTAARSAVQAGGWGVSVDSAAKSPVAKAPPKPRRRRKRSAWAARPSPGREREAETEDLFETPAPPQPVRLEKSVPAKPVPLPLPPRPRTPEVAKAPVPALPAPPSWVSPAAAPPAQAEARVEARAEVRTPPRVAPPRPAVQERRYTPPPAPRRAVSSDPLGGPVRGQGDLDLSKAFQL